MRQSLCVFGTAVFGRNEMQVWMQMDRRDARGRDCLCVRSCLHAGGGLCMRKK